MPPAPAPGRTAVVARRTLVEIARTPSLRGTALLLVLAAAGLTAWAATSWRATADQARVDDLAVLAGLLPPVLATMSYVGSALTRDLANGTLTSLLATAARPREFVLGTALALYLPGAPLLLAVPVAVEVASGHADTVTVPLTLAALILTPTVGWLLTTLTVRLAVTHGPETALVPLWLATTLLVMGAPVASLLLGLDVTSWTFLALYCVAACFLGLAVWSTSPSLSRQQVALARSRP